MPLPGPRTHCHLSRPHFIAGAPSLLQTLFLVATRCYKWHHHPLSRGHCSSERPGNRARSPSLTCPTVFQTPGLLLAQPLLAGGVRTPRESVWCLIFPARYHTCHTYPGDLPLGLHFFVIILKILPIIIIMLPSARPRSKHITYISSFDPSTTLKRIIALFMGEQLRQVKKLTQGHTAGICAQVPQAMFLTTCCTLRPSQACLRF